MKTTQVIIYGAVPTGLTLASQLQRYGIGFIILDRNGKTTHLSKAMVVQARTLEIFNEIGLAEKAIAIGNKASRFNIVTRGKIRGQLQLGAFGKWLSQFPSALILEQSKTETLLAGWLSEQGIINWNSEVSRFEDTPDGVVVFYKDALGNESAIRGDYLIGCDGSASQTRHQLQLAFEGDTQERVFYVADLKMESDLNRTGNAYFVMVENGFALFFPMEGKQYSQPIMRNAAPTRGDC